MASSLYDILLCSETLVSDLRYVAELLVPRLVVLSCCAGAGCLWLGGRQHTYEMDMEHFANPSLSIVNEMLVFMVCGERQNFYVFSHYRNPDLDDRIFDC